VHKLLLLFSLSDWSRSFWQLGRLPRENDDGHGLWPKQGSAGRTLIYFDGKFICLCSAAARTEVDLEIDNIDSSCPFEV
jgi:hypothetical protein